MTEWDECGRETISETSCSTAGTTEDLSPASHQPLPPVSSPSVGHNSGLKGRAVQSKLLTHLAKSEGGCRISDSGAGLSNTKENINTSELFGCSCVFCESVAHIGRTIVRLLQLRGLA